MPFVKLDVGILNSTLWEEADTTRVFLTALLMAEPIEITESMEQIEVRDLKATGFVAPCGWYGFVPAAGIGIVRRALMDPERGLLALEKLGAPDHNSRSSEFEGRRLIRIDGGFLILNYFKYRDRDYTSATRSQRYRERKKIAPDRHAVTTVTNRDDTRDVTQADADVDAQAEKIKTSSSELETSSDQESTSDDSGASEPSSRAKPTPKARATPKPSHEAEKLAQLLKAEILRNKPDCRITQKQLREWPKTADLMLRLDHRSYDRAAELIRWAQGDEFWRTNILSMGALREQFDRLALKAELEQQPRMTKREREFDEARQRSREEAPKYCPDCQDTGVRIVDRELCTCEAASAPALARACGLAPRPH